MKLFASQQDDRVPPSQQRQQGHPSSWQPVATVQPVEPERIALRALVPVLFGVLMLWNWRIALALLAGSFTMNAAFTLQSSPWRQKLQRTGQRYLKGENLPVALAVLGGVVATLGTYTGMSMWMQSGDRWLAIGAIGQGLVSFGILSILAWQAWQQPTRQSADPLDALLQGLAAEESLSRLLAVRQLQQYLEERATAEQCRFACNCFKLALEREREPMVREALLFALQRERELGG